MTKKEKTRVPIVIAEDVWANSQLSIARYYGGVQLGLKNYRIVNKYGIDIFELSDPSSQHYVGDNEKAINPGEPADLVQVEWIPIYKKLGRDVFLQLIKDNPDITLNKAKQLL